MRLLYRYPRTRHLEGSFVAIGDDDADFVGFDRFKDHHVVVSEKVDGANAAISFAADGRMLLQSRNRFLEPEHVAIGPYAGFFSWALSVQDSLYAALGSRYVLFGEWVRMKQSVFYDALPTSFLEFDILDTTCERFISSPRRRALLSGLPIVSAPVLAEGTFSSLAEIAVFVGPSRLKTPQWRAALNEAIYAAEVSDAERFIKDTDPSDDMEGLIIKREDADFVVERAKWIRDGARHAFLNSSVSSYFALKVENRMRQ